MGVGTLRGTASSSPNGSEVLLPSGCVAGRIAGIVAFAGIQSVGGIFQRIPGVVGVGGMCSGAVGAASCVGGDVLGVGTPVGTNASG